MSFWNHFCPSAPAAAHQPTYQLFLGAGRIRLGGDSHATRNTAKDNVPPLPIPHHLCCLSQSAHFLSGMSEMREPETTIYSNAQGICRVNIYAEHVDHVEDGDFRPKELGRNISKAEESSCLTCGYHHLNPRIWCVFCMYQSAFCSCKT